jgi:hypothetical protein
MNKSFCLILLLFAKTFSYSQNKVIDISGLWQAEQSEVTSMYHDTYQFFPNGRFVFKPDEYNGLNRIIRILGSYEIKDDSIVYEVDSTEELLGGCPIRSEITTLSDTWEIFGGQVKIISCLSKVQQYAILKFCKEPDCILIDDRNFYRIVK